MKVDYIQHCGDDLSVVNAARVSFNKESEVLSEKDKGLINYLAKHKHFSPFNHTFITLRVKAPIFVARQLVKHEYMPFNEISRRYVKDEVEFYQPEYWRKADPNIKQGSSKETLDLINLKFKKSVGSPADRRNPAVIKFARLAWRAKKSELGFDLEIEDVIWNEFCPYLNIELNYETGRGGIFNDTAVFDRIDPNKGYVKGNVQTISDLANRMKTNASQKELETFVENFAKLNGKVIRDFSFEGVNQHSLDVYINLLEQGVAPEMARMVLPQNLYTTWYWSGTLKAWAKMYNLRIDAHSQWETQQVAKMCGDIISPLFPYSWEALVEHGC